MTLKHSIPKPIDIFCKGTSFLLNSIFFIKIIEQRPIIMTENQHNGYKKNFIKRMSSLLYFSDFIVSLYVFACIDDLSQMMFEVDEHILEDVLRMLLWRFCLVGYVWI